MWPRVRPILRSWWAGYFAALVAIALMSLLIAAVLSRQRIANISMLYLIVVLAAAVAFGRGPAIFASVVAFITFDWLFVEPFHTLTVADPAEWIALLLFLLTATIAGQLAALLHERAQTAQRREREAIVLYDVVRLMSEPDLDLALHSVAERLRQELALAAVAIELSDHNGIITRAAAGEEGALRELLGVMKPVTQLLAGSSLPTATSRGGPGRWVRVVPPHLPNLGPSSSQRPYTVPVKTGERRAGSLSVVRGAGSPEFTWAEDRLLSAVASQLGLALERVGLRRQATEAEILRRTDELKSALLNTVSHDLRTPLSSILASAASLRQRDVQWSDEERRELAEAIEEEALRLDQIVGNLLDLSRIEGGHLRPEKDWYDVGTLVEEVLGRLKPLTAHHAVTVDISGDLPPLLLDYVEIDQVLSNLIENAIKYTKPGTYIKILARRDGDVVRVEVLDQGPGIPPAALPRLFEPFYRAGGRGQRPRGTGLGLAVAKGLVEAHGGRIWAENPPQGGARFVFTLPLSTPLDSTLELE